MKSEDILGSVKKEKTKGKILYDSTYIRYLDSQIHEEREWWLPGARGR